MESSVESKVESKTRWELDGSRHDACGSSMSVINTYISTCDLVDLGILETKSSFEVVRFEL